MQTNCINGQIYGSVSRYSAVRHRGADADGSGSRGISDATDEAEPRPRRCSVIAGRKVAPAIDFSDSRHVAIRPLPQRETMAREREIRGLTCAPERALSLAVLDVSVLQRSVGNRATARLLAGAPSRTGDVAVQRAVIPAAGIAGLAANLDTSDLGAARAQIDQMWNGGRRKGLADLWLALKNAQPDQYQANSETLRAYIKAYLDLRREDEAMASNSGFWDQQWFDFRNRPADETGITNAPGRGEQLPAHPTALQTHALAVRSWQIGDIVDGVSWSTLGRHLQGRMSQQEYIDLGHGILGRRDLQARTNEQATRSDVEKEQIARASCARVSQEIRVGVGNLPTTEGVSYRAATAAVGVYGTLINVGDLIKDQAFWSTAGLRQGHTGSDFGNEGTLQTPKVYYIVNGSTGVFLPKYTNKEVGVREVLYRDQTIFRVTKITNYADRTFFVWVSEVDPTTLGLNPATRNPWSGAPNP